MAGSSRSKSKSESSHGGPLWEPLCHAQIGGLTFATFVTLLLVPVIYATLVLDLKLVKTDAHERGSVAIREVATHVAAV